MHLHLSVLWCQMCKTFAATAMQLSLSTHSALVRVMHKALQIMFQLLFNQNIAVITVILLMGFAMR